MLYAIIAAIILIGDQWLKYWVTVNITLSTGEAALIPGVVKLVNIHNSGAAFGFLGDASYARWLFLGIAALFIIVIIVVLAKRLFKSRFANWCAVMALAGAVGNCIDRALYGYVVDMFKVEFMDFAVFNIADIFLVVACFLFIIYLLADIIKGDKNKSDDDDEEEKPRRSERKGERRSERKSERDEEPERRRKKPVTDDKYDVSGVSSGGAEFPDTAVPLTTDDNAVDSDEFWKSFTDEIRSGESTTPKAKPQQPAKPKPQQPAKPKPRPTVRPKPAAKPKAKSSEYDLESILAEFKDI